MRRVAEVQELRMKSSERLEGEERCEAKVEKARFGGTCVTQVWNAEALSVLKIQQPILRQLDSDLLLEVGGGGRSRERASSLGRR